MLRFEALKTRLDEQHKALAAEDKVQKNVIDTSKSEALAFLDKQALTLETASSILKKNLADFKAGKKPLTRADLQNLFAKSAKAMDPKENIQTIDLSGYSPFINSMVIHWNDGQVYFGLYNDVQKIRLNPAPTEAQAIALEKINQMIINDLARIGHSSDETIQPLGDDYGVTLNKLTNAQSFLALNLGYLAEKETAQIKNQLNLAWQPKHQDLIRANYPIRGYQEYKGEKTESQKTRFSCVCTSCKSQHATA